MQPSSSTPSRRTSPSLPMLLFSTFFLLLLTSTSSLALPHPPLAREHKPREHQFSPLSSRGIPTHFYNASSSFVASRVGRHSPRPTPEPISGGLERQIASYKRRHPKSLIDVAMSSVSKRGSCYDSSVTIQEINDFFTEGAEGATFLLCPGQVISVNETILLAKSGQTIQTQGGSAVALNSRATLRITDAGLATAIQAGCNTCDNLLVDSLIIDGGRTTLGVMTDGGALIELGGTNTNAHSVTNCVLSNPRGWSALHYIQGAQNSCSGAVIKNNVIGPCGTEDAIADGISLSCRNSVVQNNEIFDATDGAIVIFASPGSDVSGNTITATSRVMLGGINMVDYSPWGGDYTGTIVHDNTIMATGAQIKMGIAQGAACWGDSTDLRNFGGKVTANTFGGTHLSFGLAVAGVTNWGLSDNVALESTRFQGAQGDRCHNLGGAVAPTFAMIDPYKTSDVTLWRDQNCWTQATFQYLLCYESSTDAGTAPNPAFVSGGSCTTGNQPSPSSSAWTNANYCLLDSTTRILAGDYYNDDSNSPEACGARCTSLQYTYAGMENTKQCYCGNEIATADGQGAVYNSTSCAAVCPGNTDEICGGNSYLMSLWYDASRVSAPVAPFST